MEVKAIETVPVLVVAPLFTVVPEAVGEMVVSGGVVSTVKVMVPVDVLLLGSVTVMVGLLETLVGDVAVQVTVHPVEGVGVQVVPGMMMVSPLAVGVHEKTTAVVLLLGDGVAVQVGSVGAVVSTMKVLLVGVGSVLPARSIERIETVWVASERPVYVLGELHRE